ncbi:MAG TPA: glycosyltransferase family 2 protein [Candidatus Paceibacterota bacterium]|nr:glycosyltransferase family 2 protein [Verrucomicrobiota bacterium]HSA12684.1 glycosyltransferase family 2 protein [Candidatus Paceibacterota bacterium]
MSLLPFVSVILPVRNEAAFIAETLRAVLAQDYAAERVEVIVVDGMSEDGTRDIVQRLAARDPRLSILDNPGRIAPAALNLGIRAVRGEVILRVDGHGILPPNYLRECVAWLEAEDAAWKAESRKQKAETCPRGNVEDVERRIEDRGRMAEDAGQRAEGKAQCAFSLRLDRGEGRGEVSLPSARPSVALLAVGGAWDCVGSGLVGRAIALAAGSSFGVGNAAYRTSRPSEKPLCTDSVPFWVMRREVFERIGLFREEMLCHEDYELNYRLRLAGGRILLLPWLRSVYRVRPTLAALCRQYGRYGFWKGRFLRSHPGSLRLRHFVPPLFVLALAMTVAGSLFNPIALRCFGALVGLYGVFLLVATLLLAASRGRSRHAQHPCHGAQASRPEAARGASVAAPGSPDSAAPRLDASTPFLSFVLVPVVLAAIHLCWGTGVWLGLARGPVPGQPPKLAA